MRHRQHTPPRHRAPARPAPAAPRPGSGARMAASGRASPRRAWAGVGGRPYARDSDMKRVRAFRGRGRWGRAGAADGTGAACIEAWHGLGPHGPGHAHPLAQPARLALASPSSPLASHAPGPPTQPGQHPQRPARTPTGAVGATAALLRLVCLLRRWWLWRPRLRVPPLNMLPPRRAPPPRSPRPHRRGEAPARAD